MAAANEILELELDLSSSILVPLNATGDIEWPEGKTEHRVRVKVASENIGIMALVVNKENGEPIEYVYLQKTVGAEGFDYYEGASVVAHCLKDQSRIQIGVVYSVGQGSAETNLNKSTPLPIKIKSSIKTGVEPTELKSNFSVLDQLIKEFEGAKALKGITSSQNGTTIYFYANFSSGNEKIGEITLSANTMGIEVTDGGGKVGSGSALSGDGTGFAGGKNSKTQSGAAVGENAYSRTGFAGGSNATANGYRGIAIGESAAINSTDGLYSNDSIAIGTEATVSSGEDEQIAIGTRANITQSKFSVFIGSSEESTLKDSKNCIISSNNAVGIGSNSSVRYAGGWNEQS